MRTAQNEAVSLESLAKQERDEWFVRDMLVEAALRHTRDDRMTALQLLKSAIAQLAPDGEMPSHVSP